MKNHFEINIYQNCLYHLISQLSSRLFNENWKNLKKYYPKSYFSVYFRKQLRIKCSGSKLKVCISIHSTTTTVTELSVVLKNLNLKLRLFSSKAFNNFS